jgi:hypothetical protein
MLHHINRAVSGNTDKYFGNVGLLLHGDGTNGSQNNTFLDSSTNNFTVTRNGNVTQGSFSPFSSALPYSTSAFGGSGYFDGAGDYLSVANNAAINMGTSDFTIEGFFYLTATPTNTDIYGAVIVDKDGLASSSWSQYSIGVDSSLRVCFQLSAAPNAGINPTSSARTTTTVAVNSWNHFALTRSGVNATLWLNGVSSATVSNVRSNLTTNSRSLLVGWTDRGGAANQYNFPGYISNLRIVKGTVLYTSTFTPPTAPLTAITNTQLLCNFTNAAIFDNSAKNNLETVGNAQISTSVKKFGTGSLAFDGTGDWLAIPSNQNISFGTGNFTIEAWVYVPSTASINPIICIGDDLNATGVLFYITNGAKLAVFGGNASIVAGTTNVSTNTWHHVAWVRSGSTNKIYLNGTSQGTATNSVAWTGAVRIGAELYNGLTGGQLNGYIDDLRITKGIDRYTANFTPYQQPFPNR